MITSLDKRRRALELLKRQREGKERPFPSPAPTPTPRPSLPFAPPLEPQAPLLSRPLPTSSKWSNAWWREQGVEPPEDFLVKKWTPQQRAIYERTKREERLAAIRAQPPERGIGGMAAGLETVPSVLKGIGTGAVRTLLQPPFAAPTEEGLSFRERAREALRPRTEAEALGQLGPALAGGLFAFGLEEPPQFTGSFWEALAFGVPGGMLLTGGLPAAVRGFEPSLATSLRGIKPGAEAFAKKMIAGQPRIVPERVVMARAPKKPPAPLTMADLTEIAKLENKGALSPAEKTRLTALHKKRAVSRASPESATLPKPVAEPAPLLAPEAVALGMPKESWQMTRAAWDEGVVYHATKPLFLASVRKSGLKPGAWFTSRSSEAQSFTGLPTAVERGGEPIFAIRKSELQPIQADPKDIFGQEFQRPGLFVRSGVSHQPIAEIPGIWADNPHKYLVRQALSEGKPVPPEVLADYPDLAGLAPKAPPAPKGGDIERMLAGARVETPVEKQTRMARQLARDVLPKLTKKQQQELLLQPPEFRELFYNFAGGFTSRNRFRKDMATVQGLLEQRLAEGVAPKAVGPSAYPAEVVAPRAAEAPVEQVGRYTVRSAGSYKMTLPDGTYRTFSSRVDAEYYAKRHLGATVEPTGNWVAHYQDPDGAWQGKQFKTRQEAIDYAKGRVAVEQPAPAKPTIEKPAPKRAKKLLPANAISDFQEGKDVVIRKGDRAFVHDTMGQHADVEVAGDMLTPEYEANLRKLTLPQRDRMRSEIEGTPFLSQEGKAERIRVLDELTYGARAAEVKPPAVKPPAGKVPVTWKFAERPPVKAPVVKPEVVAEAGVAKPPLPAEAPPQARPSVAEAAVPPPPPVKPPVGESVSAQPPTPIARPPAKAEGPPAPLPGTARSMSLAGEMVRQVQPGLISRGLDALPGMRQIYRFFVPARGLPRQQHVAWVGRSIAESDYLTRAFASRVKALSGLDEAFGPEFNHGAKASVSYIGPPERAKSPLIGTNVDVLPNPDFYKLTATQQDAIAGLARYEDEFLNLARDGYGTPIGRFPRKEGAAFVPNVDVSESALEVMGDAFTAVRMGRAKPRVWADAISRQQHTPAFKPEMNLELLLAGSDMAKGQMVANEVFKFGAGGLTKLEVLQKTHPKLADKMIALRKRLQSLRGSAGRLEAKLEDAVDEFLASPVDDIDLTVLKEDLEVKLATGPRAGMDVAAIQKEIDQVRAQIKGLQPAWKAANLSPYVFVQEGIFRYFPVAEAKSLRQLLEVSRNPALSLAWEVRNIAFNLDLSPMTGVQLPLGILADPVGTAQQVGRGISTASGRSTFLRAFQPSALADDIARNVDSWAEFAAVSGRPIGATPIEFAGGVVRRIPGYSKLNEGMFNMVTLRSKAMFDDMVRGLEKAGVPHNEAIVAASEAVHRAIPLVNPALLGQSQARAKLLQSITISPSFLLRPPELMAEASKAFIKAGLKQTLTPKEKMALRVAVSLAATITTISVASAMYQAQKEGKDVGKAAIKALMDMSVHLPGGRQVPLGGPFRSLVNAMRPRWIGREMDYMLPFANMPKWGLSRLTPAIRRQYDLIKNEDFQGRRIMKGEFPVNILEALRYEFEGTLPLGIGAWVEGWRTGTSASKAAEISGTQLMGQQIYERPGPWAYRSEWRDDIRPYLKIPSDEVERSAEPEKWPLSRREYLEDNPERNAKLFILGETESLETEDAFEAVKRLIIENKIPAEDIRAVRKERKYQEHLTEYGQEDEREDSFKKDLVSWLDEQKASKVTPTPSPRIPTPAVIDRSTERAIERARERMGTTPAPVGAR